MAGELIVFSTGAQIMIHNPSTMCWGDKSDFEKTIASLDKCKSAIIEIYNTHAIEGVDYAELMSAETWANGETAKTIFANIVTKDMQGKEAITNRFQNRQQQFNQILTNQNQSQQ
jgi:ATP-dependent protease ClpP protease subunit